MAAKSRPHVGFRCWADATRRIPRSVGADERPHKSAQARTRHAPSCEHTYNGHASSEQVKHAGGEMTGSDQSEGATTPDTVDRIVADLIELRTNAGVVPYAEIARRIGRRRERAGNDGPSHAPARSTIYDAFRSGRSRLDAELVGDIVIALGEDEQSARTWKIRCYSVQAANERRARPTSEREAPAPEAVAIAERIPDDATRRILPVLGIMIACIIIDGVGHALVGTLHLALYLDMIGTAVSAIVLGPWYGVAVAILGTATGTLIHGTMALPFALVNVAGALVWGYGVRKRGAPFSFASFFTLNVRVALVCTLVAVPILLVGYHGGTGHEADRLTQTFAATGRSLVPSVLLSNVTTSLLDKLVTGFIALTLIHRLRRHGERTGLTLGVPTVSMFRAAHLLSVRPRHSWS